MDKVIRCFKSPLVVGYKGEIGSFILQGLLKTMPKALNIFCCDINETKQEVKERIQKADIIFLCVPLHETINWLTDYKDCLKDKLILEQTSLKSTIFGILKYLPKKFKKLNIWSMHILFRPSATPNKNDRKVALIKRDIGMGYGWKHNWINRLDLVIKEITNSEIIWFENYKEHDKAMARQQALVHRILLVLSNVIKDDNHQTYIGKKVLELTDRIKSGDPELYKANQNNKYLTKEIKLFNTHLASFSKYNKIG